ncbi:TPA: hypothetical protein HA235_03950 [Candidatus Woesearchaeota archaeon]|nr:hypothetical protein [uncultured archaeon]MBS3173330.1 hypothetical protein [Candidatus Woesearchaeota archaeon]HIH31836.1 hypothetical protein [Candidatus Woesearchaeota archaeon]HIH55451.1 hypothetical protein [Candidatus Woesearchaeota archaeon]HIJ01909.1 hypothetical protein [Candidatus Woesearchaeota archaeon]
MDNDFRCDFCNKNFQSQEAIDSHNKAKHTIAREKNHKFSVKTVSIIAIILLAIVSVTAFSIMGNKTSNINGNAINTASNTQQASVSGSTSDNVQTAKLSVSGSSYILEPSIFKKDVPVKIIADISSMPGCSKAVTIPAFRLLKVVSNKDNVITFTPTKTGTFKIACSMNMYTGTLTVE